MLYYPSLILNVLSNLLNIVQSRHGTPCQMNFKTLNTSYPSSGLTRISILSINSRLIFYPLSYFVIACSLLFIMMLLSILFLSFSLSLSLFLPLSISNSRYLLSLFLFSLCLFFGILHLFYPPALQNSMQLLL